MNANTKRDRLIDSAAELFHKKGVLSTSLADIAKHAEIPIGNVYYYFKAKDELAMSAVEKRKRALEEIYEHVNANVADPRERLIQVVSFFDKVKEEYMRYGCPIYRMVVDGGENDKEGVSNAAAGLYTGFIEWAESQFRQLGHGEQAKKLAYSLLAGIQGGAVMARAFKDPELMANELTRLSEWIAQLPNKKIFLGKGGVRQTETAA